MAKNLAFGSTKRSPCSDFQFSIFGLKYSRFTQILLQKCLEVDVKKLYLEPKIENLKSEQGDRLVDSEASFCAIFVKIGSLSSSD